MQNISIDIQKPTKSHLLQLNPNIFFDKIFIINLPNSTERWNKICKNLINNGIFNFERQVGISLPRKPPEDFIPKKFYYNFEAYGGRFKTDPDYILNCVGTNLAHFNIVKKSHMRNYKRILILEDDAFLDSKFNIHFKKGIFNLLQSNYDWDLFYFGFKRSRPQFKCHKINNYISKPTQFIRGAYGYALNSSIFPILLKSQLYGGMEIDVFFEFVICRICRVLCFTPTIISHRDGMTSTITKKKWKVRDF